MGIVKGECEAVIGGEGPLTDRLKRENTSANIHFVGRIMDRELAAHYHAADVFIFPSITKNEAFGVALAEAMWCGKPSVTFTIPGSGVNWVNIGGHTGIEVDNGNAGELAEAIDHLLANEELRLEYGRNAHRRVADHMTPEKVGPLLDTLYS
jgi:glycosyltransferase involved in cell wall biosynthesis